MKNSLLLTTMLALSFAAGSVGAFAQNPGSLDLSFDPGTGANDYVYATVLQSDGRIVIGGGFTSYNGTPRNGIARVNADGSLDTTFDPGEGVFGAVGTAVVQSDGKIIIGGTFTSYNLTPCNSIARLNEDGSLDTTFDPVSGVDPPGSLGVSSTAIQSDGKILIGGFFSSVNGIPRNGIARLNTDGSLDMTFDPGTGVGPDGAEAMVSSVAIQSDGKILIGGHFFTYNGTPTVCIARLNEDGSLDTTFAGAEGYDVRGIAIQNDGRIVIGGVFSNRIRRLNSDGSLDMTFDLGSGVNGPFVNAMAIQSDGRILAVGRFWSCDGTPRNNIARLNSEGSVDMTFDPGAGANDWVHTSAIQSDGRIIIGGFFTSYDGTPRNRIARLNCEGTVGIDDIAPFEFSIFPNPASSSVTIVMPDQQDRAELVLRDALGQEVLRSMLTASRLEVSLNGLTPGVYAVQVNAPSLREAGPAVQRTHWLVKE